MHSGNNKADLRHQVEDLQQRIDGLEKALLESEEKFHSLADSAPVGIYLDDAQGNAIYINKKCAELVGVPAEDALSLNWIPFLHPDDREIMVSAWEEAFKNSSEFHLEYRWVHLDGKVVWTLGEVVPIMGDNGKATLFIGTLTDITARKQAEAEKENLQAQLIQAQRMESIGRLAGGVAHDFNNMLSVILGHTELAMEQMDRDQPIFNNLQQILQAANRSTGIARQLLAFARQQIVSPKVIDLNETVAGMVKMLLPLIGEDIDLTWLPGKRLWPIEIDPSQIDQILVNLCVNARDAIAGVGKITVEAGNCTLDEEYCSAHAGFVSGQYVKIGVSDNGSGMDKETVSHVFEPFFTTKGVNEGTGLGLATIYGIVKQNNGFINVYSEQGHGTTFSIYLPRYVGKNDTKEGEFTAEQVLNGNETILLVEDESMILNMTTTMLQRLGYTVLAVGTPSEAVRLAGEHSGEIDLVLTDVIMPEMNGRMLKENLMVNRPGLKCLFMSGYTANVISQHGVLDDGVNFIQKPFATRELATKIRQALANG